MEKLSSAGLINTVNMKRLSDLQPPGSTWLLPGLLRAFHELHSISSLKSQGSEKQERREIQEKLSSCDKKTSKYRTSVRTKSSWSLRYGDVRSQCLRSFLQKKDPAEILLLQEAPHPLTNRPEAQQRQKMHKQNCRNSESTV